MSLISADLLGLLDKASVAMTLKDEAMQADKISLGDKGGGGGLVKGSLGPLITEGKLDQYFTQGPITTVLTENAIKERTLNEDVESAAISHLPASALIPKENTDKVRVNAGPQWFNMVTTELTPDVERDLKLLKIRQVLDRKRFYKKDDSLLAGKKAPPVFQIGTIMDSPLDHFNRLKKKERKSHIVDELLADDESREYFKKRFTQLQEQRESNVKKSYNAVKRRRLDTFKAMQKQKNK